MGLHISQISCGIIELTSQGGHEEGAQSTVQMLYDRMYGPQAVPAALNNTCPHCHQLRGDNPIGGTRALCIFSHQDKRTILNNYSNWCFDLAAYIKKQKLGEVVRTRTFLNPNSGNDICMWMWYLDKEAITRWATKRGMKSKANVQGQEA